MIYEDSIWEEKKYYNKFILKQKPNEGIPISFNKTTVF